MPRGIQTRIANASRGTEPAEYCSAAQSPAVGEVRHNRHKLRPDEDHRAGPPRSVTCAAKHRGKSMCAVYAPTVPTVQAASRQRHGNSANCGTCGAPLAANRASRRQRFCSASCRDAARRSRNFQKIGKARYPHSGMPRSDKNSLGNTNASRTDIADRGPRISWHRIIEIEIIAAHDWQPLVSTDGVTGWATFLKPPVLVRNGP